MASEMDRFYDVLSTQAATLEEQGKLLAAIGQAQLDTKERLFGTGNTPGLIPYMANEHKELSGKQELLGKELAGLKSDRRADRAYVVGAAAVISMFLKAGLNKLGLHF